MSNSKDVKYIKTGGDYKVKVFCWDGTEYIRNTDEDEIKKHDADGFFLSKTI